MFILGVDTESTGLSEQDELVEVAACLFDSNEKCVLGSFSLIVGGDQWSEQAARIHNIPKAIRDAMPRQIGSSLDAVLPIELAQFVIAHNANHDKKFVNKVWPELMKMTWLCTLEDLDHDEVLGRRPQCRKLTHLALEYGFNIGERHRALADAELACRIASVHDLDTIKARIDNAVYHVIATGPFDERHKEVLKKAGMYWKKEKRCWYRKYLSEHDAAVLSEIISSHPAFRVQLIHIDQNGHI